MVKEWCIEKPSFMLSRYSLLAPSWSTFVPRHIKGRDYWTCYFQIVSFEIKILPGIRKKKKKADDR